MPYEEKGWAYWWYLRVDGIQPGETIALNLGGKQGRFAHPEQAAFSIDGRTWLQTPPGERVVERITYRIKIDAKTAGNKYTSGWQAMSQNRVTARTSGPGPCLHPRSRLEQSEQYH